MLLQVAPRLVDVELGEGHGVMARPADEDVVDGSRQRGEEPREPVEIGRVECRDASIELEAGALHPLRVSRRDDHLGSLFVRQPGGLEPDARAPADDEERLTGKLLVALHHGAARPDRRGVAGDATRASRRARWVPPSDLGAQLPGHEGIVRSRGGVAPGGSPVGAAGGSMRDPL